MSTEVTKLRKIGDVNKLSEEAYKSIKPLKQGQAAIFRLLNGTLDKRENKTYFGATRTINLHDTIKDPGTGELIEIGIPDQVVQDKVVRWKKLILNGGGPNGLVGEYFTLVGGNNNDELAYVYLCLSNENLANPKRDQSVPAKYELVDQEKEAKKRANKRTAKMEALNLLHRMTNEDMIAFAASKLWNPYAENNADRVGEFAEEFPTEFIAWAGNAREKMKSIIELARLSGIISYDPISMKYTWTESGTLIVRLNKDGDKDHLDLFADWIGTAPGAAGVYDAIKEQYEAAVNVKLGKENQAKASAAASNTKKGGSVKPAENKVKTEVTQQGGEQSEGSQPSNEEGSAENPVIPENAVNPDQNNDFTLV